MTAVTGPSDVRDAKRLAELEVVIERGKAAFIEVGSALTEVRESRLYRLTYGTFEDYCRLRWDLDIRRAQQFMEAARVANVLEAQNFAPSSESQARELAPLLRSDGPDAVREAWSEAVARSEGKPTAQVVRQVVAEIIEPAPEPSVEPAEPLRDPAAWAELRGLIEAALSITGTRTAAAFAAEVPAGSRDRVSRQLRRVGYALGEIALVLEGNK